MYEQYPHTLRFRLPGPESTKDAKGFLVPDVPGEFVDQPCRYEDTRVNNEIVGIDNQVRRQTGTIYLPADTQYVPAEGTAVEVVGYYSGRVTKPYIGKFNIHIKV